LCDNVIQHYRTNCMVALQRRLCLSSCSLLPAPCSAKTSHLASHPHNTLACNHTLLPPPPAHSRAHDCGSCHLWISSVHSATGAGAHFAMEDAGAENTWQEDQDIPDVSTTPSALVHAVSQHTRGDACEGSHSGHTWSSQRAVLPTCGCRRVPCTESCGSCMWM